MTNAPWWKGAVIYQIYPRSFCDTTQNGVGDLPGILSKLDYIKRLGVDGVWLSPIFPSPMKDYGYDISDYEGVDPLFGSFQDLCDVITIAHDKGLKVILDQVYSHTSDQHLWFKESRSSKDNAKADWYIWADPKADGGPPNNWLSVFGGPAWGWDTQREQYYLHNFLREQPDLNFRKSEVRDEVMRVARNWLDMGVDGFRLDVTNFYYCDVNLRDNPPKPAPLNKSRPYTYQQHLYDRSQPETLDFIKAFRELLDEYDNRMAVAEIFCDHYTDRSIEYTSPDHLHTAYNFLFLENAPLTPDLIRQAYDGWPAEDAWPSWSFSNHDVVRARTRWGGENAP
ncbi:MAG: alpha-amylase family glycosyl hydrolase, partial [Pseudomonadota bacterium]